MYQNYGRCPHVKHLDGLRIAAKYDPATPPETLQIWADVFAAWSVAAHFDVGFVGPTDAINCVQDQANFNNEPWVDWTVLHVCVWHEELGDYCCGAGPYIIYDAFPYPHGAGGRVTLPVRAGLYDADLTRYFACLELGHYFGMGHGALGGCMHPMTMQERLCPGDYAIGALSQLYAHADSAQVQVQAGPVFTPQGVNRCGG